MGELAPVPFIPARFYKATGGRNIDYIVIHDMEAPETRDTAEATARMFARTDRPASAHKNFDIDSCVRSVRDQDIAYHAPGANSNGLGYEHAGYANQRGEDWDDPASRAILELSAHHAAHDAERYGIPVVFRDVADVRVGKRGFTTHHVISQAFGKSHHWDPGPNFPMDRYLDLVRAHGAPGGPATIPEHRQQEANEMAEPVDALCAPNGGSWVLTRDGGIRAYRGAPFLGSVPALKAQNRQAFGVAVSLEPWGAGGYRINAGEGGHYDFDQGVFDAIQRGDI